jgi:hypothetical protein
MMILVVVWMMILVVVWMMILVVVLLDDDIGGGFVG